MSLVPVCCIGQPESTIARPLRRMPCTSGIEDKIISAVECLPGVTDCHHVRFRYSGSQLFVDIHILIDGEQTLKEHHDLTEEIESIIQQLLPNADVTIHPEPTT